MEKESANLEQDCEEIAKESSIGTWTEIATLSADIADRQNFIIFK